MEDASFRTLIAEVRGRTDLVSVIGRDIELSPCGSVLKGRSPVNHDSDPSFIVWPATQTWRDFSGGGSDGGDCFDYLQRRDGVGFVEALRELAVAAGVRVPINGKACDAADLARIAEERQVGALLTAAAEYYHAALPAEVREKHYREHYGFTDETIDELKLGWADGGLYQHFTGKLGVARDAAVATGLFVRLGGGRIKDFFHNRLVFPYWKRGGVVYFIGRRTEMTGEAAWEKAKYKKLLTHSDKHPYVSRAVCNDTFYNEDAARGADELLITEGVTDCISARQAKLACVSPATTRFRKKDHAKLIELTRRVLRVFICNDSEDSGAGDDGAVETARALLRAGRDVRIAELPRREGVEKIDLNEFLRSHGLDELRAVLQEARTLPRFLIERVAVDTPPADLAEALGPALVALRQTEPIERQSCQELVEERFGLKARVVSTLIRQAGIDDSGVADADAEPGATLKGEVFESDNHYHTVPHPGAEPLIISSFRLVPRRRISVDDGEIIDADAVTDSGRVHRDLRFPRSAWHSSQNLLRALKSVELQWTGSDANVQGVLRLLAERDVSTFTGSTNLGYAETAAGPRWIWPAGVVGPVGIDTSGEKLVYVPSGASLADRVRFDAKLDAQTERQIAGVLLPALLELNTPAVVLPVLGWFFATPLKPRIQRHFGHFPLLIVWGMHGSGKTSLIQEVLWPLFGVDAGDAYSATETEFALIKLLSATSSVPVFIDEYKPYDMARRRRSVLHRMMRRLYGAEVEERGRADQTVVSYRLAAPVCIAGETRPTESAIVERLITANPEKDALQRNPAYARAYARVKSVDRGRLASGIVRFLLGRDTEEEIALARGIVDQLIGAREVPIRVRDNLTVMVVGLLHFEGYAEHLGVALPELDVAASIDAVLDDLLEGGGTTVKSGLDYFMEELSVLAIDGRLEMGRHYVQRGRELALHLPSCHAAYTEHCGRIRYEGEIPDRKALRRQIVESQRRGGYVKRVDELATFKDGHRRRAVVVDLVELRAAVDADGFPEPGGSPR